MTHTTIRSFAEKFEGERDVGRQRDGNFPDRIISGRHKNLYDE